MQKNQDTIIELARFEPRGWLVPQKGEPKEAALAWFENLAKGVEIPPPASSNEGGPFTAVWVLKVFRALQESGSPYWVPV